MPTYICSIRSGWLDTGRKQAIASAITQAHAEITGAPACFAQVMFRQIDEGDHFIGGAPLAHEHLFVHGEIRSGRSAEVCDALIRRLIRDVASAAAVDPFAVWVYLIELPASMMAEFGRLLPEPGQESAWLESLSAEDRARLARLRRAPPVDHPPSR
jgi:phenylpyruvate tautomerase PptA (4-oxalocrotonate tautomerase family)